jgi:hypothetical protein
MLGCSHAIRSRASNRRTHTPAASAGSYASGTQAVKHNAIPATITTTGARSSPGARCTRGSLPRVQLSGKRVRGRVSRESRLPRYPKITHSGKTSREASKRSGKNFCSFFKKKSQNPALWPPPAGRPALWPTPAAAPGGGSGCRRRGANGGGRFRGGSEGGRRHARSGGGRHCAWSKSPTSRREWRPPSRREWRSPGRLEVAGESGGRRRGGRELRSLGRGEWRSPRI